MQAKMNFDKHVEVQVSCSLLVSVQILLIVLLDLLLRGQRRSCTSKQLDIFSNNSKKSNATNRRRV